MSSPLVAIVTPTYNGALYIEHTLDAVQAQDYDNIVHVILDNASDDGAPAIIERFRSRRIPVVVVRNSDVLPQKQNWTKAFGLVPVEARYVRYLCDDDTIQPSSISKMVSLAERNPNVGVVGSLHDCAGAVQDFFWPKDRSVIPGRDAMRMAFLGEGILMPVQMMWRKSVMDRLAPLFAEDVEGGWDLDTVFRLLALSDFGFLHENLGFTRVHEGTMTARLASGTSRAWTRDGLVFLLRHGEYAFGMEHEAQLRRFRRYYVRRIIQWWRHDRGATHLRPHLDALSGAGFDFDAMLVGDALFDLLLGRLRLRSLWRGYPGWQ